MKTFKEFLEEASNAVQTFRDKGFRTRNLFGPGGRYKKLEPIPKPNTFDQAKGKKFGTNSKTNPKALERPEVRDAIFTGKANYDKKV